MTFSTFAELNRKMIEHFQARDFQQALELIERVGGKFSSDRAMADYWTMCAAARVGNRRRVFEVAERFHRDGLWYGEMMWRMTPSFKDLQGDAAFEALVAKSLKIQAGDSASSLSVVLEITPDDIEKDFPLIIALHGNQQSASKTLPFWKPAANRGFGLVTPQSRQEMFSGGYIWDNLDLAFQQVADCLETARSNIEFDGDRLFLAGHSMGGLVAIQMALTGAISARGFIANGPALPFEDAPEAFENALASARARGLRAYFIVGEKDADIEQDAIRAFAVKMKAAGIPCELEIVPGATHDYHPGYDAALLRGLEFVNS